jgi:hypothetical protein
VEGRIARRELRLLDVRPRLIQELENVVIVDGVVNLPTGTPRAHEPQAAKQPQLVRGGGLTNPHERCDVADAELPRGESVQDPHSGRIPQRPEGFGQRLHRAGANETRPPGGDVRKRDANAVARIVLSGIAVS